MKKGQLLLVYGTLRKDERADIRKQRGFAMDFLGMDEVNGLLYHLGAYPGFKPVSPSGEEFNPNDPSITGEVFFLRDQGVCSILDHYEGYHPENPASGLYDRAQFLTKKGRLVWVYIFNGMVCEEQTIETGDWKNPRLCVSHRIPRTA